MTPDAHERLASGIATGQAEDETFSVQIVPIPEGETTVGLSEEATYWPRETLKAAVDDGVFQGSKLLKSPGGEGHKEMFDLADPDNIVGRVTGAEYQDGVGPVLEADLIDEQMARLVEHDLVGVSPDMFRDLGEYDEQLEAAPATRIHAVPYVTILDRGASPDATIKPAQAEALAASDAGQYLLGDGDGEGATDDDSPGDEGGDVTGDGSGEGESPGESVPGETDTGSAGGDNAPGPGPGADGPDGGEGAGEEDSEGPTGAAASADSPVDADDDDTSMGNNDPNERIQELQEQLAAAKQENEQLRDDKDDLEEETSELEETIEEKEERLDETESELEQTEEELEAKSEEAETFRRSLAERVAQESPLSAEQILDSDMSTEDLAESVVNHEGLDEDEDGDKSPTELVAEQLASSPAQRGDQADEEPEGGTSPDEEQLAAANEWAYEALTGSDIARLGDEEQLSPRDLAEEKTGVDPAECGSRGEFKRKADAAAVDGGDD